MTEESYKYTAKDDRYCKKLKPKNVGATVSGVFNISSLDEDGIVKAVAHKGPVSVAFEVSADFRFYSHGVYDSFNATTNQTVCNKDAQHVNHAVVAVGYGETTEEDPPVPFHIIRNSWGNTWGMEGYFWMLRGENMCGISDCASFPLVPSTWNAPHKKHLRTKPDSSSIADRKEIS
jgi:cathepsin H